MIDCGKVAMAWTQERRGLMPVELRRWPRNSMSKQSRRHFSNLTTRPFGCKTQTTALNVLAVVGRIGANDEGIIKVNKGKLQVAQKRVYAVLKCHACIMQAEWQVDELK